MLVFFVVPGQRESPTDVCDTLEKRYCSILYLSYAYMLRYCFTPVLAVCFALLLGSGSVFLHCLPNGKSYLEDPPSISEGCGGRVTDYRTQVKC